MERMGSVWVAGGCQTRRYLSSEYDSEVLGCSEMIFMGIACIHFRLQRPMYVFTRKYSASPSGP